MKNILKEYEYIWGEDPQSILTNYSYQTEVTQKLDNLNIEEFNRESLYEIILWKLDRSVDISSEFIQELKFIATIKAREHFKAHALLEKLLRISGIALPMASTILRFLNPKVFQIIDDRAFRVVFPTGTKKYPTKPSPLNDSYIENSIKIYFEYLDTLHSLCSERLPFHLADRILYQLDIALGNKIGSK
ncbi:hypothetical protein [Leptospira yasudae]|uniref:Uncharacterized protein n=1 Tax=Leptospira yasudae TaxID=2202201 RepID=A0A6N4R0P7_9LEPT|nr:hypothetical protein [Leptospira yasudae]TGL80874.1 hypothetical protein EHQ72_06595 [Leptospira yasudae]TGL81674.1 hypothetical protein EHQ77_06245 [Leptospira yasudae]TGL88050.1 hypothetical protein EHQ83_03605 [Leptospira yasudae]